MKSSQEAVDDCRQLFAVYGMDAAGPFKHPAPQSPAGVLDAAACGSCDTQKSASEAATPPEPSPPTKRRRLIATISGASHVDDDGKAL